MGHVSPKEFAIKRNSWVVRNVVGRFWWLEPYDTGVLCPFNTWTSALRNIYRQRRRMPELGPLRREWIADGREMLIIIAAVVVVGLRRGIDAAAFVAFLFAFAPMADRIAHWFWRRVVRGER